MEKTGILGFGNMGEALTKGLVRSRPASEICIYDRSQEKMARGAEVYHVNRVKTPADLFAFAGTVILAIKPQDTDALLKEISPYSKSKKIITIIAGRPTSVFANALKTVNICRFMPNIAALCGRAMTAVSFYEKADESFIPEAVSIAESIGSALILPENLIPAVTALSGSGIAFVFQFIHAMAMGGVRAGLSYNDALRIAAATAEGAVETLKASGKQPAELLTAVTSPAGTTIEGLRILEDRGFSGTAMDAVYASYRRALEIEGLT